MRERRDLRCYASAPEIFIARFLILDYLSLLCSPIVTERPRPITYLAVDFQSFGYHCMEAEWKDTSELDVERITFQEVLEFFDVPSLIKSRLHGEPPILLSL